MFGSKSSGTPRSNSAARLRFPYGSLAAVLLTSFGLGCVIAGSLLQDVLAAAWEGGDPLPLVCLVATTVSLLVTMVIQVSYVVERAGRQPVAVPEDAAVHAIQAEVCDTAVGAEARSPVARVQQERVPLAAAAGGNGPTVPELRGA